MGKIIECDMGTVLLSHLIDKKEGILQPLQQAWNYQIARK